MYECSSWLGFEANAKWKVVEAATANNTQLYQLVNDDCASNVLRVWAPTGGSGCVLAFPGDPAGGACSGDPCVPIAGSVPIDTWQLAEFTAGGRRPAPALTLLVAMVLSSTAAARPW